MGRGVLPPSREVALEEWAPKLKHYPHFDKSIRPSDIKKLVRNADAVARNSFYPFLRFAESWQPFRSEEVEQPDGSIVVQKPEKKVRELRFASRRDAYIYSYYRNVLSGPYEAALAEHGLSENVIAYRKLTAASGKGKSNIDFALDAFEVVRAYGDAAVVTLDISKFFESIDHELLRVKWAALLGMDELPKDHKAVHKAITQYAVVDRDAAYETLGYLEWRQLKGGKIPVYTTSFKNMPKQLCSNKDFREKICGKGGKFPKLIKHRDEPYGIPQGSPISDLLANLYLLDFDRALKDYVDSVGGTFFRYSDDIIIILPGGDAEAIAARDFAMAEIHKHGPEIVIKEAKTSVLKFHPAVGGQAFVKLHGTPGRNGLEYLGFRYDGRNVYLRDTTISRLYRKVTLALRAEARVLVRRYPGKDQAYLEAHFDASKFMQKFGRVEEFDHRASYATWTFWTYAKRAVDAFGPLGMPISKQLRNYATIVRTRMKQEIAQALKRRL